MRKAIHIFEVAHHVKKIAYRAKKGLRIKWAKLPGVTSSEPRCKNLVVLRHPREFIDMSPTSLQLNLHFPFPDINCLSNSTPAS